MLSDIVNKNTYLFTNEASVVIDTILWSTFVTRIVSGTPEETGRGNESDTIPLRHNEPSLHTFAIMFSDERSNMDNTVREQTLHSQVRGVKC